MASLHFNYSTMNAGKTTELLQTAYNYEERGMGVVTMLPEIDTRSDHKIQSRMLDLCRVPDFIIKSKSDLLAVVKAQTLVRRVDAVLVDEAQFLSTNQVHELARVVDDLNIPVLCYGLRTDFTGTLFPGSLALLSLANKLKEIPTICHCGKKAQMVLRLDSDGLVVRSGPQVQVGGNDMYISVCRKHWSSGEYK